MSIFFVTCKPRSRSSWMSNLLTYGGSFCFHDAIGLPPSVDALEQKMVDVLLNNPNIGHVGDSDSGLLLVADKVVKKFPEARWLFINRPRSECESSYREHFKDFDPYIPKTVPIEDVFTSCDWMYLNAKKHVHQELRMEIDVADLDNLGKIQIVWQWLAPGEPFCSERAKLLDKLQINPFAKKIKPHY